MKTLSLWNPWGWLLVFGAKRNETRDWATPHRGPLAIHAAKKKPDAAAEELWAFARDNGDVPLWTPERARDLPSGCVVAIAQLVEIFKTETCDCSNPYKVECPRHGKTDFNYGNYGPDRFGWVLREVEPLLVPVPVKGERRLFNWDWEWHEPAPDQERIGGLSGMRHQGRMQVTHEGPITVTERKLFG